MSALAGKREAMARVDKHADERWKLAALEAVSIVCDQVGDGGDLVSDFVWSILESEFPNASTHNPKALGPIMRKAAKLGWIEKTDRVVPSEREECNARPVAVWKVLPF